MLHLNRRAAADPSACAPPPHEASDVFAFGLSGLAGVRTCFARGEEIFYQGGASDHVYRVVSGVVSSVRYSSEGGRQIMRFHFAGDIFGLDPAPMRTSCAETITDVEVLAVRSAALNRAVEANAANARALIGLVHEEVRLTQEHTSLLGLKTARERLFRFLTKLAEQDGESVVELPMSRADIADHLALTIETVSRTFTELVLARAISLPRARCVILHRRGALKVLAPA